MRIVKISTDWPVGRDFRVEHRISPPQLLSVTIPLCVEGKASHEFVLYLTCNAFSPRIPDESTILAVAEAVRSALDKS